MMTPAEKNLLVAMFRDGRYTDLQNNAAAHIEKDRNSGFAWQILGAALEKQGQDGLPALKMAAQLSPADAGTYNNLGNALRDHGQFDEATASYRRALTLNPDFAMAHCGLGFTLRCLGQLDDAVASYRRALALKPDYAEAYNNLGNVLFDRRQLDEAVASYQRALEINPDLVEARDAMLVALQFAPSTTREVLFAAHLRFGKHVETPLQPRWPAHANRRAPDKRLKIGYVSGDFRMHAVAYFIEPVLAEHDRSQVEVFCYSNSIRHDAFTDRLIAETDHWRPCLHMTDAQLAEQIGADGIDILVDLAGHAAHNRLRAFAHKPAPIQITYLGYPGTTGLTAMDYRLTDNYTEPVESDADHYYTEKLIRLPDSLWCYRPDEGMPAITPLPAQDKGYLTFGSFNNVKKIGADCIALWASLLHRLPTSRLLMATVGEGTMRERLAEQFTEHGIGTERISFCGGLPPREFQRKLQEVDVTLDPFPVNGATTTCESLWLGVPVLTLVGEGFLTRAGLSVLSAAHMPEFAATTWDDFIDMAARLANDLPRLASIRAGMRERLRASPLLDQQRFTRNLEKIYREVWRKYTLL